MRTQRLKISMAGGAAQGRTLKTLCRRIKHVRLAPTHLELPPRILRAPPERRIYLVLLHVILHEVPETLHLSSTAPRARQATREHQGPRAKKGRGRSVTRLHVRPRRLTLRRHPKPSQSYSVCNRKDEYPSTCLQNGSDGLPKIRCLQFQRPQ